MATISDVAEAAGVHVSTVSRVLNGRASKMVSPATRERILSEANKLNYRPSAAARALASGRSRVVAIAYARPDDPHFLPMLVTAHRMATDRGYQIQTVFDREQLGNWLRERRADVALDVSLVDSSDFLLESVSADHQRVVSCGPVYQKLPERTMCAYWHDCEGIRLALQHLRELGHERIAMLAGRQRSGKVEAFEMAAGEMSFDPVIVRLETEGELLAAGARMARNILDHPRRPTAIIARTDEFACGALHALREAGVAIPDDISIVGFNDIPTVAYLFPPLTTVRTPLVQCAEKLLPIAFDSIDSGDAENWRPECFEFHARLVIRSSTGPPRA